MRYTIELIGPGRSRQGHPKDGHYLTRFKKNDEVDIYITKSNNISKVPRGIKKRARVVSNVRSPMFTLGTRVRTKAKDYMHYMVFEVLNKS